MFLSKNGNYCINDLLGKSFKCSCGKEHKVDIDRVIIENGVLRKVPKIIREYNYRKAFIVADNNTYEAAGKCVENSLKNSHMPYQKLVFSRPHHLVPDEQTIGEFLIHMEKDTDVIVAVGSGVINDLCKYMSFKLNIPYIIIATAPSMDGYASDGSALMIDNLKTTLSAVVPKAIIADIDVLKNAPMKMIRAGFGDMVGKYSALNDWKLSNIITGEYYCEAVAALVEKSLEKCINNAAGIGERKDEVIKELMEGLVLTGIAMSFAGNSRPASGSEHHMSHFWEMMFLFEGREPALHGINVGVNTVSTTRMREILASKKLDFDNIAQKALHFDQEKWTQDIKDIYSKAAPGIIKLNKKEQINSLDKRLKRLEIIRDNWDLIVKTLKEIPSAYQIKEILKKAGAAISPKEVGVDENIEKNCIVYGKEVRARYTILQLLWDIGLLGDIEL
jgi:glycerol-1-phosphate dehydrogenase [NAD(P)+]